MSFESEMNNNGGYFVYVLGIYIDLGVHWKLYAY